MEADVSDHVWKLEEVIALLGDSQTVRLYQYAGDRPIATLVVTKYRSIPERRVG
jgi:hypothetical protein